VGAPIRLVVLAITLATIGLGGRWLADRRGPRPPGVVRYRAYFAALGVAGLLGFPILLSFIVQGAPGWNAPWAWVMPGGSLLMAAFLFAAVFRYRLVVDANGITEHPILSGRPRHIDLDALEAWEVLGGNRLAIKVRGERSLVVSASLQEGVEDLVAALQMLSAASAERT
jgi:hypothetical protein